MSSLSSLIGYTGKNKDRLAYRVEERIDRYISAKTRKEFRDFLEETTTRDHKALHSRYKKEVDELILNIIRSSGYSEGKKILDSAPKELRVLATMRFSDAINRVSCYDKKKLDGFDQVAAEAAYALLILAPLTIEQYPEPDEF